MDKNQIISIGKDFLLDKYRVINKNYTLFRESLICNNFEKYPWKNAEYRFDLVPLFDLLYLPKNSAFIMAHRFLVDGSGNNVLEEAIYKEENSSSSKFDSDLPFYPGIAFFQAELDKINHSFKNHMGKKISVKGERIQGDVRLTWNMGTIELIKLCDASILEKDKFYYLKHKLEMVFLLDEGNIPDFLNPHSWCEYYINKESGEICDLRLFDQSPPCLI